MTRLPTSDEALPGRDTPLPAPGAHFVNGHGLQPPYPPGMEIAEFSLGCFWGAERRFWEAPGVYVTAVGYTDGLTPNPTYEEVCSGLTGHSEAVRVVFDPAQIGYEALLGVFWESHDPTQGMRQGNDVGTQYRSVIHVFDEAQRHAAEASMKGFQEALTERGYGRVTTDIKGASQFFFAEDYHQQYLAKNLGGYCGLGGTGVSCPTGLETTGPA